MKPDNTKWKFLIEFIRNWLPLAISGLPILVAYINKSNNYMLVYSLAIFIFILWLSYYLIVVKKILHLRGVFAVAAIIIDDNNDMLLIKENGFYKQPGAHYRTNRPQFGKELKTPYIEILDTIRKETGLGEHDIELIDLSYFGKKGEYTLKDQYNENKDLLSFFEKYLGHKISPPPFFLMQEYGDKKSSKEKFHIAMYYGFKVKNKQNLQNTDKREILFTNISISDFKGIDVYRDLIFVYERFISLYKETNYPRFNIRLCRFNDKINTVCWRLTDKCNAICKHCFIPKKNHTNSPFTIKINREKLPKHITDNHVKKLIISGGEPFLVKNLSTIVEYANNHLSVEKFSICTNGIYYQNHLPLINNIKSGDYNKFDKFVISLETYESEGYKDIKQITDNSSFAKVLEFIKKCCDEKIKFNINVIGSSFFISNPKNYIDFWREKGLTDITISFPVKSKENTKTDLLTEYQKIINGTYGDVSFLRNLELIIPVCEDLECCPNGKNIFSIDCNGNFRKKCVDLTDI